MEEDRWLAATKRVKLEGNVFGDVQDQKPAGRVVMVDSLKNLCLKVLVPIIIAKRDRYLMMNLGSDIAQLCFSRMKQEFKLTSDNVSLFMHSHLQVVDLSGYYNTTQAFLDVISFLGQTLTVLNLKDVEKIVDYSGLGKLTRLEMLDLSGTKFSNKYCDSLKGMSSLLCLRVARSKLTCLPSWLPQTCPELTELDVSNTEMADAKCMHVLRKLVKLQHLSVAGTPIREMHINSLKHLISLNVSECPIQNASLYWMGGCSNLLSLDLGRTGIGGKGLFQLRSFTRLESLVLPPSSNFCNEDFAYLTPLARLTSLSVPRFPVSDLDFVKNMSRLAALDLSACPVSDLSPLKHCVSLTQLNLQGCTDVRDLSLSTIPHLPLVNLNLAKTGLTDASMQFLADCPTLSYLQLQNTTIGTNIRLLTSLKRLCFLDVRETGIDPTDLTALQSLNLRVRKDPVVLQPLAGGNGAAPMEEEDNEEI